MTWSGWSVRDGAARAAVWLSQRQTVQIEGDIQKLASMLTPTPLRARWKRAIDVLLSND